METAFTAYQKALSLASHVDDKRLLAEIYDGLSQLYEDQHRAVESLSLVVTGIHHGQAVDAHDLLINLEWRQARLLREMGRHQAAIVAFRNAVDHIEAIRQDIPVTYQNGRSSFRDTLAPIYFNLADLLLHEATTKQEDQHNQILRQARDTIELLRQFEMDDYLGNRCATLLESDVQMRSYPSIKKSFVIPADIAVIYPILFPDRIELLMETDNGIDRSIVQIDQEIVQRTSRHFAESLRDEDEEPIQDAQTLYRWLLAPLADKLAQQQIKTLVLVPDGVLRLFPFGALHDGQNYVIERYAIDVVPGLNLMRTKNTTNSAGKILLAGMSVPGKVVEKLTNELLNAISNPYESELRTLPTTTVERRIARVLPAKEEDSAKFQGGETLEARNLRYQKLQKDLSLPGVTEEIHRLTNLTNGSVLFNKTFTLERLREEVLHNNYRIIHLATHGVFGPTADTTFVMTYDDLLTINSIQDLLRKREQNSPLELLALSACQTAEGDDRAPMGLSGAAIQAKAASALGSLWPVSDEAASRMMSDFYDGLLKGKSKAEALRASQIKLLKTPQFSHPLFWAPFILVGNWQ